MKRSGAAITLGLCSLLAACSTVPRVYRAPAGPYGVALQKATRSGTSYLGFDPSILAYATHETPEFRKARAEYLADAFHDTAEGAVARIAVMAAPFEGQAFLVSLNMHDRAMNDLERPNSRWGLTLESPQGLVHPTSIRRLTYDVPLLQELYPYSDRYFVAYRAVFPPSGDGPFTLIVSGPLGEVRLKFDASPPASLPSSAPDAGASTPVKG